MRFRFLALLILMLVGVWGAPLALQAAVVGHFLKVEGQVDVLPQGRLPAAPARVRDGVAPGDVIRTKSQSRAMVQFVDDTTLTIAPGSRVAVADYHYDAPQGPRRAALHIFQGLVYCVVHRLFQVEQPDFLMRTHTAAVGVRGTRWFTLLGVNFTDILAESGLLGVRSILPDLPGEVILRGWEFTRVTRQYPPTLPRCFTREDFQLLEDWLINGVPAYILEGGQTPWSLRVPQAPFPTELYRGFPEGLFVPPLQHPPHHQGTP